LEGAASADQPSREIELRLGEEAVEGARQKEEGKIKNTDV